MKRSEVHLILKPEFALAAGKSRLLNEEDMSVQTDKEAREYKGASFIENEEDCIELHIVYVGGMACVNFLNEDGVRVNYDYPIDTLARIKTL